VTQAAVNGMPVRWGVLGVARIAIERVLPPVMQSPWIEVVAIGSRSLDKAKAAAATLGIPRAYGTYDEMLASPEIEAVYIPLPNSLHFDWTLRAIEAGKHVLCEKPLAPSAGEVAAMHEAAGRRGLLAMEAFMLFSHPRLHAVRDLIRHGGIGRLGTVRISFTNPNLDPNNIRNRVETGGGALLDKGCYAVALARYLFDADPKAVTAVSEMHPTFGVDCLTTAILQFPRGMASFDCSSTLAAHQQLVAIGTDGYIEMDLPVTPDPGQPTTFRVGGRGGVQTRRFAACNQYRLMFDEVSAAIRGEGMLPVSPEFSVGNAQVIENLFRAAAGRRWIWHPGSQPQPADQEGMI
jgi:predicted dehydrogenase